MPHRVSLATASFSFSLPGDRLDQPVLRAESGPQIARRLLPDSKQQSPVERVQTSRRPSHRYRLVRHASERTRSKSTPTGLATVLHFPPAKNIDVHRNKRGWFRCVCGHLRFARLAVSIGSSTTRPRGGAGHCSRRRGYRWPIARGAGGGGYTHGVLVITERGAREANFHRGND